MVDILGHELKVGSLVLGTSSSITLRPLSFGLLIGENEVFKVNEKGIGKISTCKNILYINIDTDEKRSIYNNLVTVYNNFNNLKYKVISDYVNNVEIGDLLKTKYGKRFYLGYCSVTESYYDIASNNVVKKYYEGYLYVTHSFVSDLKDELNSKTENITYKAIFKRLFMNRYTGNSFVFVKTPLPYIEKLDSFTIMGKIDNYKLGDYHMVDYNSFKELNMGIGDCDD